MAIFLTAQSRVMIQGITGGEGRKHGARMLASGAKVVGGTNPKKAGTTVELNGEPIPVFATVRETIAATGADVSVIFVPAAGTKAAVLEAIDAEIPLAIVEQQDTMDGAARRAAELAGMGSASTPKGA